MFFSLITLPNLSYFITVTYTIVVKYLGLPKSFCLYTFWLSIYENNIRLIRLCEGNTPTCIEALCKELQSSLLNRIVPFFQWLVYTCWVTCFLDLVHYCRVCCRVLALYINTPSDQGMRRDVTRVEMPSLVVTETRANTVHCFYLLHMSTYLFDQMSCSSTYIPLHYNYNETSINIFDTTHIHSQQTQPHHTFHTFHTATNTKPWQYILKTVRQINERQSQRGHNVPLITEM